MFTLVGKAFLALGFAVAADLHLNVGDSVTITPNVTTQVTCGPNGNNDCNAAVDTLRTRLNACEQNFSAVQCLDKYWPAFRTAHPTCIDNALNLCLTTCEQNLSSAQCADKCQ